MDILEFLLPIIAELAPALIEFLFTLIFECGGELLELVVEFAEAMWRERKKD